MQIMQLYRMSTLITSLNVQQIQSFAVLINCFYSFFVHFALRHTSWTTQWIVCILIDCLLDATYAISIPISLLQNIAYYIIGMQKYTDLFNEVLYSKIASAGRQLFVGSWLELLLKMTPELILPLQLRKVQAILFLGQSASPWYLHPSNEGSHCTSEKSTKDNFKTIQPTSQTNIAKTQKVTKSNRLRLFFCLDGLFCVIGFAIMYLLISSRYENSQLIIPGCLLPLHPIASLTPSCAVFEVNCEQSGHNGRSEDVSIALSNISPFHIRVLVVSHCQYLEIPPAVEQYANLGLLKIYNSTIIQWNHDIGLTKTRHPRLQWLFFIRTNFSSFPEGLIHEDFPTSVYFIAICESNVEKFPDHLPRAWSAVTVLYIERSPLIKVIPSAVLRLFSLRHLSLAYNQVQALDGVTSLRPAFNIESSVIDLRGNPVRGIPEDFNREWANMLIVGETNITKLPESWYLAPNSSNIGMHILAWHTPLCESLNADIDPAVVQSGINPNNPVLMLGGAGIYCTLNNNDSLMYPLQSEEIWRKEYLVADG